MAPSERLAVIGDPIGHSISPVMQSAALAAAGPSWTYEARHILGGELRAFVSEVRDGRYRGFNVTIPHKRAIIEHLDYVDPTAEAVDAVNTVVREDDRLVGYNTDPIGFLAALHHHGFNPDDARVILFGAGGAARAVAYALAGSARSITIVNRTLPNAENLATQLRAEHVRRRSITVTLGGTATGLPTTARPASEVDAFLAGSQEVLAAIERADLLVNATSLGMSRQAGLSPLPNDVTLSKHSVLVDLVYGRETPFLAAGRAHGCAVADGMEMLVQQGAASFRLWTGMSADVDIMRSACMRALEPQRC